MNNNFNFSSHKNSENNKKLVGKAKMSKEQKKMLEEKLKIEKEKRKLEKSIEKKNEAQQKYDDLVKQANKINQNKANKSSQLTAEQRKVYEKAKEAKKAGNMDEYHKNMNIVSGMRKQQKITENKVPTSSSTTSSSTRSKKHTNVRNNAYKPTTPTANSNKSDFNNKNNIDNI